MVNLQTPTSALLDKYIDKFNKDDRYSLADQAITRLFSKFPENKEIEDILLKTSVINDLYSANIFGTVKMAKHIWNLQIDNALKSGDAKIVNKIAVGHGIRKPKSKGDRNFYSFATKYCNWHNNESYPIYDRFVHKMLISYRNKSPFSDFEREDLKDYSKFTRIITDFRTKYSLGRYNFKKIDKFLFMYGRELFPTNYRLKQKRGDQQ